MLKRALLFILSSFLSCLPVAVVYGQTTILIRHTDKDTAYIREYYRKHLVIRAYESTKFNNFKLIDGPDKLIFKPNNHNNIGLGFIYRFISINLGVFDPATGKNVGIYGITHEFDLQLHVYVHRYIIDIYSQFYHGYYLENASIAINNFPDRVLIRPDVSTRNISISGQYVFNDKRFSYNAPFYQNERQKKNAGSFLLGGGIYHFDSKADSAFIPSDTRYTNFFQNHPFNAVSTTGLCVNVGYAYTLVIKKLFFVTAILSGGAGVDHAALTDTYSGEANEKTGLEVNLNGNFAAGYNSDNYFAGVTYIRLVSEFNVGGPNTWQEVNSGNFRFTVAKRFRLKKALIPKSDLIKIEDN